MNTLSIFFERYSLILFFALTILLSYAITPLLTYAISLQILPPDVENLFVVLIPTLVALFLAAMSGRRKGISGLLKKLVQWRIGLKMKRAPVLYRQHPLSHPTFLKVPLPASDKHAWARGLRISSPASVWSTARWLPPDGHPGCCKHLPQRASGGLPKGPGRG